MPLIDAYKARRALDYLVGFHLSPILWGKLPGARSAGIDFSSNATASSAAVTLILQPQFNLIAWGCQDCCKLREHTS